MPNIEAFGSFTSTDADKTSDQLNTSQQWIKFKLGEPKVLRILPPLANEDLPWVIIHQHFLKIPGGKAVPFNCPNKHKNERCPACEMFDKLMGTGNPTDEKMAREMYKVGTRGIARAIDRENPDAGVRPVGLSQTVIKALNEIRKGNKLNGETDFTHPLEGFDLVIERKDGPPWYTVQVARNPSPLAQTDAGFDDIINQMHNLALAPFAKVLSYDDIVKKIQDAKAEAGGGAAQGGRAVGQPAPQASLPTGSSSSFDSNDNSDPF